MKHYKKPVKAFIIVLIIGFSLLAGAITVTAPCPGDPGCPPETEVSFEESFKDNPSEGFNTNPSKAWQTVESNPNMMDDPKVMDAAFSNDPQKATNIINKNPNLMNNQKIYDKVEQAAQDDTHILNNNPKVMEKFLSQKGINVANDKVQLASYNANGDVTTRGSGATNFNIQEHAGATILEDGSVVLADSTQVSGASISLNQDATINIDGGYTDVSDTENANIHVTNGEVQRGDMIYTSSTNEQMDITTENGKTTIHGNNIIEMDTTSGQINSEFSGIVTNYEDGHREFGKDTSFTDYIDGQKSRTYTVTEPTEYHNTPTGCDGSANCIQEYEGSAKITSKNNNQIELKLFDDSIRHLTVDEITDESTLIITKSNSKLTFSSEPFIAEGSISRMGLSFTTTYKDKDYNFEFMKPGSGQNQISKEQFLTNMEYLMDQGYSIHDIAFAYQNQFYESLDYYGGVLTGTLSPLSISEGEQGMNYQDPNLVQQMEAMFPKDKPYVNDDGLDYKISHTFAGIAAAANTNSIWGKIKTWANTDGGDWGQVIMHTGGNILGGNFDIASGYRSEPQIKGNAMGRDLAQDFRSESLKSNSDSSLVIAKFEESFNDIRNKHFRDTGCNHETGIC